MGNTPTLSGSVLAILFVVTILGRDEFRLQADDLRSSRSYQHRRNGSMKIGGTAIFMSPMATVTTMNLFGREIFSSIKRSAKILLESTDRA